MVNKSENGDGLELGAFGFKIKITGKLAKQALIGLAALAVIWYGAWSRPQTIIQEIHAMRRDVTEIKVTTQAIIDSMPDRQKEKAKGLISDRLAVAKLAQAN